MALKVGISGLGRIGKGVLRVNYAQENAKSKFEIVAIKDIISIENLAYLLKHDSLYGLFDEEISIDGDYIIIGDKRIRYYKEPRADKVPWKEHGVDYLIESSGKVAREEIANVLKDKQVRKAICTWNIPKPDITLVQGINNKEYDPKKHNIISSSTCTGNGLVPVMHILESNFGVEYGHIITIHPVLSDQKLMDVSHEYFHLGRMATSSIIPTSTSVVKSTLILMPSLAGKLDCISYRVPTSIVSVIDLSVTLKKETTADEVKAVFEKASKTYLKGIINCDYGFLGHRKVSIDFIRSTYSSIILVPEIQLTKGKHLSLSMMHDNEWAYCNRVMDIINFLRDSEKNG